MKKVIIFLTFLILVGIGTVVAAGNMNAVYQDQEEELIPSEDSVSIDDADPIFYDAEEEEFGAEKSGNSTKLIIGIAGGVILLGLGFLFITRSRSKKEE